MVLVVHAAIAVVMYVCQLISTTCTHSRHQQELRWWRVQNLCLCSAVLFELSFEMRVAREAWRW